MSVSVALLSLAVCAALIAVLSPRSESKPAQTENGSAVEYEPDAKAGAATDVSVPTEVLRGQFVILYNREWSNEELSKAPDEIPPNWGAGRLVPGKTDSIRLGVGQSLGYLPDFEIDTEEAAALSNVPKFTALQFYPTGKMTADEMQRVVNMPGLRSLATTPDVAYRVELPKTITALSLNGPPARWNFPWVTSLEVEADYYGWADPDDVPTPLPENLDHVETLFITGWPKRQALPATLRRLQVEYIGPASLRDATAMEWINDVEFLGDGDRGLDVFASFPWLTHIEIDCTDMTDAGLMALSRAVQVEELCLDIDYDGPITSMGVSALTRLPRLKYLRLEGGMSDDALLGLRGCAALETLDLGSESMRFRGEGLAAVQDLPNLRLLDIHGCGQFSGIGARFLSGGKFAIRADFGRKLTPAGCREVIANWPSSCLSFEYCDHLGDDAFEGLEGALGLRCLILRGCDRITRKTLDRVLGLKGLEELILDDLDAIDDDYLVRLAKLPNLKTVSINRATGVTARGLLALTKTPRLEKLNIVCKGITTEVVRALHDCPNLDSLELPWFGIGDSEYDAVWQLIDARPDMTVYAHSKGNPYAPENHP